MIGGNHSAVSLVCQSETNIINQHRYHWLVCMYGDHYIIHLRANPSPRMNVNFSVHHITLYCFESSFFIDYIYAGKIASYVCGLGFRLSDWPGAYVNSVWFDKEVCHQQGYLCVPLLDTEVCLRNTKFSSFDLPWLKCLLIRRCMVFVVSLSLRIVGPVKFLWIIWEWMSERMGCWLKVCFMYARVGFKGHVPW